MNILLSLFALAAIVPGVAFAHSTEPHDELIIRMTENGFEPKEMTVTEGDEILFINNDDVDRWPASNFHPSHTLYLEFDPQRGIPPGESWKHVFDKPGTWRMHDHLIPHMTGTIVVLEDPAKTESASTTVEETVERPGLFKKIGAAFSNLWKSIVGIFQTSEPEVKSSLLSEFRSLSEKDKYAWLENRARDNGAETAWRYVLSAYETPEGVIGKAHDMAHLVGQLLFKEQGLAGLGICGPNFAFGCYHGLMEIAFDGKDAEGYAESLLSAEKSCEKVGDYSYSSCIHGMGHGIVTFRKHNLDTSLSDCDKLKESGRAYCYDGIFMELSNSAAPNFYSTTDPLYPCSAIEDKYQTACARSQPWVMKRISNLNDQEIADTCGKAQSKNIQFHCVDALGYLIGQKSLGKASLVIEGCGVIGSQELKAQCLAAAAGELVFQNYTGWQTEAFKVCESLLGAHRAICEDRIKNIQQTYERN